MSKTDGPGQKICDEVLYYYTSRFWDEEGHVVLRAVAKNTNDVKSYLTYYLWAYDKDGKIIGNVKDIVALGPKRHTEPVTIPVSIKNEPLYGFGDNSQAFVSTAIGAGSANEKATSWGLTITCTQGVTLTIPSKTPEPGQNVCGKTLYYYSASYFNIKDETPLINAGAVNSNRTTSSVTYVLTAYDHNGKVIGSAKDIVALGPKL